MQKNCVFLAALLVFVTSAPAVAQDELATKSEDQMIAEAIWSIVEIGNIRFAEKNKPIEPSKAFDAASKAFPKSAKVKYWHGRLGEYSTKRATAYVGLVRSLGKLAEPDPDDSHVADRSARNRIKNMRAFASILQMQLHSRAQEASESESRNVFEFPLAEALALDQNMTCAWVALLESSDQSIALNAANAWAELEPHNALPHYAKAVILTRDASAEEPMYDAAIKAMEIGNTKPDCRVPTMPWPTDITLSYPVTEELDELSGKPVDEKEFRRVVEGLFSQISFLSAHQTISGFSLMHLGGIVRNRSHALSRHEDVRSLRAFAGVGLHMVNSNHFVFGITAGSVDRVFNRLEMIAVEQNDFDAARKYEGLRNTVLEIQRKISIGLSKDHDFGDSAKTDALATKVMKANPIDKTVPNIRLIKKGKEKLLITDDPDAESDMVLLKLFSTQEIDPYVRKPNETSPPTDLSAAELAARGYRTLEQTIEDIRKTNRTKELDRGILILPSSDGEFNDVWSVCDINGYLGKRDPCIIAVRSKQSLSNFREWFSGYDIRIAQFLYPGRSLDQTDVDAASPEADLYVLPSSRVFDANGEISPLIRESKKRFLIYTSKRNLERVHSKIANIDSIIGILAAGK